MSPHLESKSVCLSVCLCARRSVSPSAPPSVSLLVHWPATQSPLSPFSLQDRSPLATHIPTALRLFLALSPLVGENELLKKHSQTMTQKHDPKRHNHRHLTAPRGLKDCALGGEERCRANSGFSRRDTGLFLYLYERRQ